MSADVTPDGLGAAIEELFVTCVGIYEFLLDVGGSTKLSEAVTGHSSDLRRKLDESMQPFREKWTPDALAAAEKREAALQKRLKKVEGARDRARTDLSNYMEASVHEGRCIDCRCRPDSETDADSKECGCFCHTFVDTLNALNDSPSEGTDTPESAGGEG